MIFHMAGLPQPRSAIWMVCHQQDLPHGWCPTYCSHCRGNQLFPPLQEQANQSFLGWHRPILHLSQTPGKVSIPPHFPPPVRHSISSELPALPYLQSHSSCAPSQPELHQSDSLSGDKSSPGVGQFTGGGNPGGGQQDLPQEPLVRYGRLV